MRRTALVGLVIILSGAIGAHAQIAVFDAAVTARNSVTAVVKEYLIAVQRQQHSQLRRMAQRLSLFTDLSKYSLTEPPLWRIHDFETPAFAGAYHAALNYGDATGAAYVSVSQPVTSPAADMLGRLTPAARQAFLARLATVDATDAVVMAATHDSGRLRYNGRRERLAIDALDHDVIDPSNEQSLTAVADKISGAVLIGVRQRQARVQLLSGLVEQLLVDGKRARDSEAATLNMQLVAWRDRNAANSAFVRGTGDALREWRQP